MHLSTSTNILNMDLGVPHSIPMEVSMEGCRAAGYDRVDANICEQCRKPGQPMYDPGWEAWAHKMREAAERLGLTVSQSHAYWAMNPVFLPGGVRADGELGEEMMRRSILVSEILGVEWMVVHPYTIYKDDGVHRDLDASRRYNIELYKRWGEFAHAHGVGIAIENMPRGRGKEKYAASAEDLLELREAIGCPGVELCIDTGHAHLSGYDVAEFVGKVGPHLRALHIADNYGEKDEHLAPYNGTIDWKSVVTALREIGYRWDFAFEIHRLTAHYPKETQQGLVDFSYRLGRYLLEL